MKRLKYQKKITLLEFDKLSKYKLDNKSINLINFSDVIKINGFFIFIFFIDLKKISKKILFGSPDTIKIGL